MPTTSEGRTIHICLYYHTLFVDTVFSAGLCAVLFVDWNYGYMYIYMYMHFLFLFCVFLFNMVDLFVLKSLA